MLYIRLSKHWISYDTITFQLNETKRIDQINKKYNPNKIILQSNMTDEKIPKERKLFVLQGINTASAGDYFAELSPKTN